MRPQRDRARCTLGRWQLPGWPEAAARCRNTGRRAEAAVRGRVRTHGAGGQRKDAGSARMQVEQQPFAKHSTGQQLGPHICPANHQKAESGRQMQGAPKEPEVW